MEQFEAVWKLLRKCAAVHECLCCLDALKHGSRQKRFQDPASSQARAQHRVVAERAVFRSPILFSGYDIFFGNDQQLDMEEEIVGTVDIGF